MKDIPRAAIDFEVQVREVFYTLSVLMRKAMQNGDRDFSEEVSDLAWFVTPKIFPVIKPEAVSYLTALAVDMPKLMTREPEDIQGLRFNYDILPLTPLRILHANVIELAVRLIRKEIVRLHRIGPLSDDCRHIYNWMQKRYVEGGFIAHGCVSVEDILRNVLGQTTMQMGTYARVCLEELVAQGFVERGTSIDAVYFLSAMERRVLIGRYCLASKWTTTSSSSDEVADVQRALMGTQE